MRAMIVHPDHTSKEYMRELLLALPPSPGESVLEWCMRTATRLEGKEPELYELFRDSLPNRMYMTSGPVQGSVFFTI